MNSQDAADAYFNSGNAKSDSGDYQGAIADYDKAIEINPQNAAYYYNRGYANYKLGDRRNQCIDVMKAASLGDAASVQLLSGKFGDWCRDMS